MKSILDKLQRIRKPLWILFALAVLVIWPVAAHLSWAAGHWKLHGVPMFFLVLVVFLGLGLIVKVAACVMSQGLRWLGSKEAFWMMGTTFILIGSAVVLFYTVELWRGKRAWARIVEEAARQGQSLDPKTLTPAPVPDDQDFAKAPMFAALHEAVRLNQKEPNLGPLRELVAWSSQTSLSSRTFDPAPWLEAKSTDLLFWARDFIKRPPFQGGQEPSVVVVTNENEIGIDSKVILQALTPLDGLIDEMRAYSQRPYCRLPYNYDFPILSRQHSENVIPACLRLLRLRASAELASGKTDEAGRDLDLILRLADYQFQQPECYSLELHAYSLADALQPLWEGMLSHRWNATQVEGFQRRLQEIQPMSHYSRLSRFIALSHAGMIETIAPTKRMERPEWDGFAPEDRQVRFWLQLVFPVGWSLQDQSAILGEWLRHRAQLILTQNFTTVDLPERAAAFELMRHSSDPLFPVFVVPVMVERNKMLREFLSFDQTFMTLATVACGLERHFLSKAVYPERLEALAPEFLEVLPLDPMSKAPLRYRRGTDAGFMLYSIGFNGNDDQGKPSPRRTHRSWIIGNVFDLSENDWVWSTLSTPNVAGSGSKKPQ
jgi:hypothetical protein